jgi:hypothetical protein
MQGDTHIQHTGIPLLESKHEDAGGLILLLLTPILFAQVYALPTCILFKDGQQLERTCMCVRAHARSCARVSVSIVCVKE